VPKRERRDPSPLATAGPSTPAATAAGAEGVIDQEIGLLQEGTARTTSRHPAK
jgi:hypothetical protein